MTKKSRQKLKYLENEKCFWGEIKSIFHHFYKTFSCQKLPQTWECAFNVNQGLRFSLIILQGYSKLPHLSSFYVRLIYLIKIPGVLSSLKFLLPLRHWWSIKFKYFIWFISHCIRITIWRTHFCLDVSICFSCNYLGWYELSNIYSVSAFI